MGRDFGVYGRHVHGVFGREAALSEVQEVRLNRDLLTYPCAQAGAFSDFFESDRVLNAEQGNPIVAQFGTAWAVDLDVMSTVHAPFNPALRTVGLPTNQHVGSL